MARLAEEYGAAPTLDLPARPSTCGEGRSRRSGARRVLVVNSTERTGGNDDIVSGMLQSANENGYNTEPITVRGQETQLVQTADDSYATVGVAGECAVVMVISTSEKQVRDAVKQID